MTPTRSAIIERLALLRRVLEVFAPYYDRQPYGMHLEEQNLLRDIRALLGACPSCGCTGGLHPITCSTRVIGSGEAPEAPGEPLRRPGSIPDLSHLLDLALQLTTPGRPMDAEALAWLRDLERGAREARERVESEIREKRKP